MSGFAHPLDTFYKLQFAWLEALEARGVPIDEQALYQFPTPKAYNCGAVGANGFVFTPNGEIHKCGLEVDDSSQAVGSVHDADAHVRVASRFDAFSPFRHPVCRECEFLPTCLGGCPRNRLDGRDVQVRENCEYHKQFERQILLFHLGHRANLARAETPSQQPVPRVIPLIPVAIA